MTTPTRASTGGSATGDRIVRHASADRLLHWITAACVLTLLGTAFLPIVGVEFGWVTIHWVTGQNADDVSQVAPKRLLAPAAVLDFSGEAAANPDFLLEVGHIRSWESRYGKLPAWHSGAGSEAWFFADEIVVR